MPAGDVHPLPDPGLGNTSYLLDLGGGGAAAIDPPRDVDHHLDEARRRGLRITASLETHLHADFVSGSRELAVEVIAHQDAGLEFPHRPVRDGDTLQLGDLELRVLHTPGHTPEHVSYTFAGAVFSGGSLIVSGAARTDLIAPGRTADLARAQFRSLRALAELPDETRLHPTHGAGSFCSAGPARSDASTIGDERRSNRLLALPDEDAFAELLIASYGSFPPYFLRLREVNRRGPVLVDELPAPRPMDTGEAHATDAVLVDCRSLEEWAAGHPASAVSNALRPAFASWLGWIVPFGAPFILLALPRQIPEALRQARRIGYDNVLGWLDGGFEAWRAAGLACSSTEVLGPRQAADRGTLLLDVRQDDEVDAVRVPGAAHIELGDLIAGRAPDTSEVVTFCGHGERSATAASLLERRGMRTAVMAGGISAWEKERLPLER